MVVSELNPRVRKFVYLVNNYLLSIYYVRYSPRHDKGDVILVHTELRD